MNRLSLLDRLWVYCLVFAMAPDGPVTNIVGVGWTSTHNPTNALDLFAASSPTIRGMTMQITA